MSTCRWSTSATTVLEQSEPGWAGVWSLLYTAGTATTDLAAHVPLVVGAELMWAAMSLRWARDEVEHAHVEAPFAALAIELGVLGPDDDTAGAGGVVVGLCDAILERLALLTAADTEPATAGLADRVGSHVRGARDAVAEALP